MREHRRNSSKNQIIQEDEQLRLALGAAFEVERQWTVHRIFGSGYVARAGAKVSCA
jgi:hypothetical protein